MDTTLGTGAAAITTADNLTGAINLGAAANTLDITGGSIAGNVTGGGGTALSFDLATGNSFTYGVPHAISGVNSVTMNSGTAQIDGNLATNTLAVNGGRLILNSAVTASGGSTVSSGTLVVGDDTHASATLSGSGIVSIATSGTLGGFGSISGSVINNGILAVGNALPTYSCGPNITFNISGNLTNSGLVALAGAAPGNALKVAGNYTSNGGVLALNTVLNAGGPLSNQSTDRLLIAGSDPGVTTIQLHPIGSGAFAATGVPTASGGISLVQVGGPSSPGDFVPPGGYITGGTSFRYQIYAYGAGSPNGPADPSQNLVGNPSSYWDYRLQSVYVDPSGPVAPVASSGTPTPPDARLEVAPQVPAYITVPTALFNAGWQDIEELHRRLGEIRDAQQQGTPRRVEVFVRAYGSTYNYTSTRSFTDYGFDSSQDYAALQFGGSAIALNDDAGTLRIGRAGVLGRLWFQPSAVDGPSNGLFNSERLAGTVTLAIAHGLVFGRHRRGWLARWRGQHRCAWRGNGAERHQLHCLAWHRQ